MLPAIIKEKDDNSAINRGMLSRSTIKNQGGGRPSNLSKGEASKASPLPPFWNSAIQLIVIMLRFSPNRLFNELFVWEGNEL